MHELAVTEEILNLVVSEAEKSNATKVKHVKLVIGEMTGIVNESVSFYFNEISKSTIAEGAVLSFRRIPAAGRCRDCGDEFEVKDFVWACPQCGSLNIDIKAGKELYLESIEVI